MHTIPDMGERQRSLLLLGGCGVGNGEEFASQGGHEFFATKDGRAK